jgi:predicted GNAT family N-acyltransferase
MVSTLATPLALPEIATAVVDYTRYKTAIHAIRTEVFVDEQKIPLELEIDDLDRISQHVLALCDGRPIGTGRLTPRGRIGRVAVAQPLRRQGVGLCIMQQLLELARQNRHPEVVLSAQRHAIAFYEKLGFQREGEEFLEVGIVHVMMRKRFTKRELSSTLLHR